MTSKSYSFRYFLQVVILIEKGMHTAKTVVQGQKDNDKEFEKHLD